MKKIKRIAVLIIGLSAMTSCGELTYEEKAETVCDCFEKADGQSEFMKCAKLQHDYSLEEGDKKQEFIVATNKCMN